MQMYTCRGHTAPVLCVALLSISPAGKDNIASGRSSPLETALEINFAFSGSLDGEIRSWRLGGLQLMLYEAFDPSVGGPLLKGHSDAVWSIAARVSVSAWFHVTLPPLVALAFVLGFPVVLYRHCVLRQEPIVVPCPAQKRRVVLSLNNPVWSFLILILASICC